MKHYTKKGEPVSCPRCHSTALDRETKATDGGFVSEFAVRCTDCDAVVGYWAYGMWGPATIAYWGRYTRRRNPPRRLADLGRALRSLARTTWRYARGRL